MLEVSNYWDNFEERVLSTYNAIKSGSYPGLERLTVHLTEQCNLRCKYCNMHFASQHMDYELAAKIVRDYAKLPLKSGESGPKVAQKSAKIIHFTGGEPTIVPYLEELTAYAKSLGLQVSLNTNCVKRIDTTNVDKLKVSFDTPYADKFNATVGADMFDTVVDNIKHYSKTMKGKMLSITAVLNRQTYRDMLALAKFVEENFDVYNLYFSNYKGSNPDLAFTDEEIDDMFENYIPKVLEFFKTQGCEYSYKQLALYKKDDFRNVDCRFSENKIIPCYIQLSEMTIDVHGQCNNCSHLQRDGVRAKTIVNVKDHSVYECFKLLKDGLNGQYTCLSCKCLNGCNTNLIGFNRTVNEKLKDF